MGASFKQVLKYTYTYTRDTQIPNSDTSVIPGYA